MVCEYEANEAIDAIMQLVLRCQSTKVLDLLNSYSPKTYFYASMPSPINASDVTISVAR